MKTEYIYAIKQFGSWVIKHSITPPNEYVERYQRQQIDKLILLEVIKPNNVIKNQMNMQAKQQFDK